jgi:hypothetical protein
LKCATHLLTLSVLSLALLFLSLPFLPISFLLLLGFEVFLFVAEGVLLIVTAVLCYATYHVPGALNEANNNVKGGYYVIEVL